MQFIRQFNLNFKHDAVSDELIIVILKDQIRVIKVYKIVGHCSPNVLFSWIRHIYVYRMAWKLFVWINVKERDLLYIMVESDFFLFLSLNLTVVIKETILLQECHK